MQWPPSQNRRNRRRRRRRQISTKHSRLMSETRQTQPTWSSSSHYSCGVMFHQRNDQSWWDLKPWIRLWKVRWQWCFLIWCDDAVSPSQGQHNLSEVKSSSLVSVEKSPYKNKEWSSSKKEGERGSIFALFFHLHCSSHIRNTETMHAVSFTSERAVGAAQNGHSSPLKRRYCIWNRTPFSAARILQRPLGSGLRLGTRRSRKMSNLSRCLQW